MFVHCHIDLLTVRSACGLLTDSYDRIWAGGPNEMPPYDDGVVVDFSVARVPLHHPMASVQTVCYCRSHTYMCGCTR